MAEENGAVRGVSEYSLRDLLNKLSEAMPQGATFTYEHLEAGFAIEFVKDEPAKTLGYWATHARCPQCGSDHDMQLDGDDIPSKAKCRCGWLGTSDDMTL
jgi:hypothetical protein